MIQMGNLKDLDISNGNITESQIVYIVQHLPRDIKVLFIWQPDAVQENKVKLIEEMESLSSLEVVQMNLSKECPQRKECAQRLERKCNLKV